MSDKHHNEHHGKPVEEPHAEGEDADPIADPVADPVAEPVTDPAADPGARMTEVEAELEVARAEAAENRDRWLRAAAELENVRRRTAREIEENALRGRAAVLLDVVAILDDVDRALEAVSENQAVDGGNADAGSDPDPVAGLDPVVAGIRLIRTQLVEMLRRHQVIEIEALGCVFDPHIHEGVLQVPAGDVPEGCVAQVFQRGYRVGERVLRPAKVAVARVAGVHERT